MNTPPFQIGQTVYLARASAHTRVEVPCPVCCGKRSVTLILGNGEHQPVVCEMCSHGCEPPSGVAHEYRAESSVIETTVTGLSLRGGEWKTETEAGYGGDEVFADRDAAEARRAEKLAAEMEYAERMREENLMRRKKKSTWTAGYHRAEVKRLRASLEWHENKLRAKEVQAEERR